MKSILLAVFVFGSFAHAAPAAFKGYCMIPMVGKAPGTGVEVVKGATAEIHREGSVIFKITYADLLNEENVLQLTALDTATNKQSVTNVFVENEFPLRVDLVSLMGSISCFRDY